MSYSRLGQLMGSLMALIIDRTRAASATKNNAHTVTIKNNSQGKEDQEIVCKRCSKT